MVHVSALHFDAVVFRAVVPAACGVVITGIIALLV
jgi:hypothetical protein